MKVRIANYPLGYFEVAPCLVSETNSSKGLVFELMNDATRAITKTKPIIVGVTGVMFSGKSTFSKHLSNYIVSYLALNRSDDFLLRLPKVKTMHFAQAVKDIAFKMQWDGEKDDRGRKLLQDIGRIGREYEPLVWVDILFDQITNQSQSGDIVIIDDLRFDNEAEAIKNRGGMIVKTLRDGYNGDGDVSERGISRHFVDLTVSDGDGARLLDLIAKNLAVSVASKSEAVLSARELLLRSLPNATEKSIGLMVNILRDARASIN